MKKFNMLLLFILIALVIILTANVLIAKIPLGDGGTRCSDVVLNLKQREIRHTFGEGKNVTCNVNVNINITKTGD